MRHGRFAPKKVDLQKVESRHNHLMVVSTFYFLYVYSLAAA